MTLKLGTAKVDITPNEPVELCGFGFRVGKKMEGVMLPIHARILFFQYGGETSPAQHAVLISADLIWWGEAQVRLIRERLHTKWGIDAAAIIMSTSHSHSGPQTEPALSLLGQSDDAYLDCLNKRLIDGIDEAAGNMESVRLESGYGRCSIGINRRRGAERYPNDEGLTDDEVTVLRYTTMSGHVKGLIVHYTCHPTISKENRISPEFTGIAMEHVEDVLGGNAVSLFVQGCCGDIRPRMVRSDQFYLGGELHVHEYAHRFAAEIISVLHQPMKAIAARKLDCIRHEIWLEYQALPSSDMLQALVAGDSDPSLVQWARLLLQEPWRLEQKGAILQMNMLTLGEDLMLLAMNGEMVAEYGRYIKEISGKSVLPLGYSNGMIGYVPTAAQVEEGGYEAVDFIYYFGLPAPFDRSCEHKIKNAIDAMLAREEKANDESNCQS